MPPSSSGISPKAIGWALLSQVFWVPLMAIDLHDHWLARRRDITLPGQAPPQSGLARPTPFSLNDLLGAAQPMPSLGVQASQSVPEALGQGAVGSASGVGMLLSSTGSNASFLQDHPVSGSLVAGAPAAGPAGRASYSGTAVSAAPPIPPLVGRAFTSAQLLGGSITLADLQEGPMDLLALGERAVPPSSADPLAPLPARWREPMRQALLKLPGAPLRLSPARLVIVPTRAVSQPLEVPLALQSDGSIDILEAPANAAVLREIDAWSRQQRLPASGFLVPAVVQLQPLPPDAPNTVPPTSPADPGRAVAAPARVSATSAPARQPWSAPNSLAIAQAGPAPGRSLGGGAARTVGRVTPPISVPSPGGTAAPSAAVDRAP